MTRKAIPSLFIAALAAAAVAPSSALGATTCAHNTPGLLEVAMGADNDQALIQTGVGARIRVYSESGEVVCTGAAPTITNVDAALIVDESDDLGTPVGNDGGTLVSISEPATFAPGKTAEGTGASEIEFLVDPRAGDDRLVLGGSAKQQIIVGNDGANWSVDGDADMLGMPFDQLVLSGGDGFDLLTAQGASGTGAALSTATRVEIFGGNGADSLFGSDTASGDRIFAGPGEDVAVGYGGDDLISAGSGDDALNGASGSDTLDFGGSDNPVNVDLASVGQQDTGQGLDMIAQFENVTGSDFADRLSGDDAANVLRGGAGEDVLEGAGGADELQGERDADTVSYATSAAAVNVDLARTTQATDADKLFSIEDVAGSRFGDSLAGNAGPNRIDAGAGADTVSAGDGADAVAVRDGEGDRVSCGADADSVVSDRRSLDAVNADCDSVDALPEPLRPVGQGDGAQPPTGSPQAVPRCGGKRATIVGTAKSDVLRGTKRADVIVAGGGNDRIKAGGGSDIVCAGSGNDRVDAGAGNDRVEGGAGTDRLSGGRGKDRLVGGPGRDRLSGGSGRDRCSGGSGRDLAAGCERRTRIP